MLSVRGVSHKKSPRHVPHGSFFLNPLPSLKLRFSHLKIDGWKTILSFWVSASFQRGATVRSFPTYGGVSLPWELNSRAAFEMGTSASPFVGQVGT